MPNITKRKNKAGDATRITLAEFVPVYLEQKKPALSPTTYDYYCRTIELKILPALGHFKLQDIKPVHMQAFIQQLCSVDKMNRNRTASFTGNCSAESYYITIYHEAGSQAAHYHRKPGTC